jgi:predicted phage gp36 major capsid-like protein
MNIFLELGINLLFSAALMYIFYIYKIRPTQQSFQESLKKQKVMFIESGNAITDTLKVAFENLKKTSNDQSKTNAKLTEYNSRLHRLEQRQRGLVSSRGGEDTDDGEFGKTERDSFQNRIRSKGNRGIEK